MVSKRVRLATFAVVICLFWDVASARVVGQGFFRRRDLQFSPGKSRLLANKVVKRFLGHEPFNEAELPLLVAMQMLDQKISGEVTDRQLTDHILNALLNFSSKVFVVNQEPKLDESSDFKLVSYDGSWLTRQRGQLMGANFYISGSLREVGGMTEKGKLFREYEAILELRDIETNDLIQKTVVTSHRKSIGKARGTRGK